MFSPHKTSCRFGGLLLASLMLIACAAPLPREGAESARQQLAQRGLAIDVPEEQFTGPLTRQQAVQAALLHHPSIRAEYARLDIAAADVVRASEVLNPRLNLALLDFNTGGSALSFSVSQSIASLMLRNVRVGVARQQHELAVITLTDALQHMAIDTEAAWYALAAAEQRLQLASWSADVAAWADALADRFVSAGNMTPLQRSQIAQQAARRELARIAAEQQRDRARNTLALQLALPHDDWSVPSALPMPAQLQNVQALTEQALRSHPALLHLAGRVDRLDQRLQEAGAERWLDGAAVGAQREAEPGERGDGPTLAFRVPLWNRPRGELLALAAERQALEEDRAALEMELPIKIRRHVRELEQLRAALETRQQRLLPAMADEVEARQQRVNFMLEGVFTLLEAKLSELDSWTDQVDGLASYWAHEVELARTTGLAFTASAEDTLELKAIAPRVPSESSNADHSHHHGAHRR